MAPRIQSDGIQRAGSRSAPPRIPRTTSRARSRALSSPPERLSAARVQSSPGRQPLLSGACALAYASLPWRTALRLAPLPALAVGFFLPLGLPSDRAPGAKPELASNLIEMRPRGASHELFPPGAPGQVERIAGDCRAIPVDLRPSRRIYHVTASTPCRLRIRTYDFPGWSARLEGKPLPIRTELATRLQLIDLPAGLHRVDLRYKR